jgi:hypothetical protein
MDPMEFRITTIREQLTNLAAVELRDRSLTWSSGTGEESLEMVKRGHGEEEILRVLREAKPGARWSSLPRAWDQPAHFTRKKKYAGGIAMSLQLHT